MMRTMVSIIVPFYNVEKYIFECAKSLVNQSYKDFEVIFVNDGSTDNSKAIVDEFVRNNDNFSVISQENGGLSAARNTGISYAVGKYIYFLDSDDYLLDNAIERLVNVAEKNELDAIRFSAYTFTDEDRSLKWSCDGYKYQRDYDGVFSGIELLNTFLRCGDKNLVNMGHLFTRNEIIKNNNLLFLEGIIHEDIIYNWKVLCLSKRVMVCNEPLHCKRNRSGSIMTTLRYADEVRAMIESIKEADAFLSKNSDLNTINNRWYVAQYAIKSLQFWNEMDSFERKENMDNINELRNQIYKHKFWRKFNLFLFWMSPYIYSGYHNINMGIRNIWKRKQ